MFCPRSIEPLFHIPPIHASGSMHPFVRLVNTALHGSLSLSLIHCLCYAVIADTNHRFTLPVLVQIRQHRYQLTGKPLIRLV